MECDVVDIYETEGFDNFICSIANTYAAPEVLGQDGKLDYTRLKPVLFEFPTYSYLATGEIIGKCLNLDKKARHVCQTSDVARWYCEVIENRSVSGVYKGIYAICGGSG